MLRPDRACTQGNPHLWVMREIGAGRALQLILVLSSLSGRAAQAAKARDSCRGKHEEPQRRRLPQGRSPRGAARRDPGSWPEAPRCSFQVPGSPSPRPRLPLLPPPSSALGYTAADSSWVTANACAVIFPSCRGWGLGAGVWRGWDSTVLQFPRLGRREGQLRSQVVQKLGLEGPGPWFLGTSSGPCLPSRAKRH